MKAGAQSFPSDCQPYQPWPGASLPVQFLLISDAMETVKEQPNIPGAHTLWGGSKNSFILSLTKPCYYTPV